MNKQNIIIRWIKFINMRFPLPSNLLLILALYAANLLVALKVETISLSINFQNTAPFIFLVLVLLYLRIFDEIKDYETDKKINPDRPLVTGLVFLKEAKSITLIIISLLIIYSVTRGFAFVAAFLMVLAYSLLMYKEFFIPKLLEKNLFVYALTHTPVTFFISLLIYTAATDKLPWAAPINYLLFGIVNVILSLIYDVARKTYSLQEEQEGRPSYSKLFGIAGAIRLALGLYLLAFAGAWYVGLTIAVNGFYFPILVVHLCITLVNAIYFYFSKNGKINQAVNGMLLFLFYLIIINGIVW